MSQQGSSSEEMRDEYDLPGPGIRGKYYERYRRGTNIVRLDSDVASAFPNSEAVNFALRLIVGPPKFEIRRVLYHGGVVSIAISGQPSSPTLNIGDELLVIDDVDGVTLGEFEVTDVQADGYRAKAIAMDPLWAGHVRATDRPDIVPPAAAVAIVISRGQAA
jgi:hypothetical protein